jgi:hypothetical protein
MSQAGDPPVILLDQHVCGQAEAEDGPFGNAFQRLSPGAGG